MTSEIALRYGLHRNQLYAWRRELRIGRRSPMLVVPWARLCAGGGGLAVLARRRSRSRSAARCVRVGPGVDLALLGEVIRVLKAMSMIPASPATPPAGVRVLIATRPVDFRRGADGLAATVQSMLRQDPFSGTVFVFRSKRADRVKLLVYDGTGLVLIWKRLEGAQFKWPAISDGVMRLSGGAACGAV